MYESEGVRSKCIIMYAIYCSLVLADIFGLSMNDKLQVVWHSCFPYSEYCLVPIENV